MSPMRVHLSLICWVQCHKNLHAAVSYPAVAFIGSEACLSALIYAWRCVMLLRYACYLIFYMFMLSYVTGACVRSVLCNPSYVDILVSTCVGRQLVPGELPKFESESDSFSSFITMALNLAFKPSKCSVLAFHITSMILGDGNDRRETGAVDAIYDGEYDVGTSLVASRLATTVGAIRRRRLSSNADKTRFNNGSTWGYRYPQCSPFKDVTISTANMD
ncbi:hypothetical protein DFS33DRAFT_1455305 [Desarmillaria ectypa]|nr:hypothetical protein DFS33DRAFT_1455305 [Desarmillaria ectypa]